MNKTEISTNKDIKKPKRNQKEILELKGTITGKKNSLEGLKADLSRQKNESVNMKEDRAMEIIISEEQKEKE